MIKNNYTFNFKLAFFLLLFVLFIDNKAEAHGIGCNELNFTITLQPGTTCCYKLTANNTAVDNCFQSVNLNLGADIFENFAGLSGWQINMVGGGEYNISYQDYGLFPSGSMPMHTYLTIGTYIITYLAIEEDPATGLICFEKILRDSIAIHCNSTGTYWNKDNEKHIYMFPNPTSGELNIGLVSELTDIDKVMIVDIAGKKVITNEKLNNVTSTQLNISAISEGFYLLKVFSGGRLIAVKKLIKS